MSINSPSDQLRDFSQAVIHKAKSAILGRFSSVVLDNSLNPAVTTSHIAPKILDCFSWKFFQKVFSSVLASSEMLGSVITIDLSSKSGLCAISSIPFNIDGLMMLNTASSPVVYISLTERPPPVDILQRESLIPVDNPLKLS